MPKRNNIQFISLFLDKYKFGIQSPPSPKGLKFELSLPELCQSLQMNPSNGWINILGN